MKLLFFAGSLRKDSLNLKLVKQLMTMVPAEHGKELVNLKDLALPVFDSDIQDKGFPAGVQTFGEKVSAADAIIISTPEYNGSISSPLKNLIDWTSRLNPMPLAKKPVLLTGASPGALGAVRGLWHSRQPFTVLKMPVWPEMFGLAKANEAFDDQGALKDPKTREQLQKLTNEFLASISPGK